MRRIRTAVVDVAGDLPDLELEDADEWRVLVTWNGVAVDRVVLASPGRAGQRTLELALRRAAEAALADEASGRRLAPPHPGPMGADTRAPRVSVVVPTHRRPDALRALLASLAALDPAPAEVIVVDNDPGPLASRDAAEAAGARYVREDRRGLNIARRAGLRAARGDVVAFTDDDCVVTPSWLGSLAGWFADPLVGLVSGPGFAYELETAAQLRREEEAAFDKGMRRRRFDWRTTAPPHAGVVGSGNSLAIRRELAQRLEVFPPELDAGTPAPAAGDLYAIYRVLAAGYDAAYEPQMAFFHQHPRAGLEATIRNYGLGVGAYHTKLLVENRELTTIRVWHWFVRNWLEAVLDALAGQADRGRVRVRWCYLAATAQGPRAWRRALAALDGPGRAELAAARAALGRERLDDLAAQRGLEVAGGRIRRAALDALEWLRWRRVWWRVAGGGPVRERAAGDASQADPARTPTTPASAAGTPSAAPPASVSSLAPPPTSPRAFWAAVAEGVAAAETDAVAVLFPGARGDERWLSELAGALEGSRVAVCTGAGLAAERPPAPLELISRPQLQGHYRPIGAPPQYIAVRRDLHAALGGFDVAAADLGWQAPLADYVERALAAGLTIARLDSHGLDPPGTERPARTRNEWHRARARAALLARDARATGGPSGAGLLFWSGLVPLLRFRAPSAPGRRSLRHTLGSLAAFAVGSAAGLRSRQ